MLGTKMPLQLLDLPREVLHGVLRECYPSDLGKLAQCSKELNRYIEASHLLSKELYIAHFDKSKLFPQEVGAHWSIRLKKYIKLLKLLESSNRDVKSANFKFIVDATCEFLADANCSADEDSRNIQLLAERFNEAEIESLLSQSSLFARMKGETRLRSQAVDSQLSAKLHCLYGVPITKGAYHNGDSLTAEEFRGTYSWAISKVYDLRNYTIGNLWGPFFSDSSVRVDWEMMEAIMIVLGHNLKFSGECAVLAHGIWNKPFAGAFADSYMAEEPPRLLFTEPRTEVPPSPKLPPDFEDPYGVTGTWLRIVCFLDHRDLYRYNFVNHLPPEEPRDPYEPDEATRLILMRLRAVGYGEHEETDNKNMPVLRFVGATLPVRASWDINTHATMRGTVRTTKEGEIRWTSLSIFSGEERWKSEGVQVGGAKSARGVIGTWFDKDFDPRGPAGPTAFWKLSDRDHLDDSENESDDDSQIFGYEFEQSEDH